MHEHSRPADTFSFPKTFVGGCNRSFKQEWLNQHKWLCYSTKLDGAFCLPCTLFNGVLTDMKVSGVLVMAEKVREIWQP